MKNENLKGLRGGQTRDSAQDRVEREKYKKYMDILKTTFSIKDTLYEDKHYGFLNKNYQAIQPLAGIDTLRFGTYAPTVHGLNFIVDQYNEFRNFYLSFTQETGQSPPVLISDLIPGKSFSSFETKYQEHLASLSFRLSNDMIQIVRDSTKNNTQMMNPIAFFNYFNENILFSPDYEGLHISKSGYAISAKSDVYQTGLYIDLSVESLTSIDNPKGQMLADPGFLCYLTFATDHGFSIDFNAPWRLILNMEHEKTITNILNGRPAADYWDFYYDQYVENIGFSYDYNNIRDFYETLYKTYYRMYNNLTTEQANRLQWEQIYQNLFSQSLVSSVDGPGQIWVKIFTLNRLREVGLINTYEEFSTNPRAAQIVTHALGVYGQELTNFFGTRIENRVSTGQIGVPTTGVAAYITTECGNILKEKMIQVE